MEPQEEFKTLLEALKFYQANLLSSGHQVLGFMVVALGWLATSQGMRDFLAGNLFIRQSFVVFLGLSVVGYSFMVWRVYAMSQSVSSNLVRLDYARREVYSHYAIRRIVPIYYTVFHLLISALMGIVILNSK